MSTAGLEQELRAAAARLRDDRGTRGRVDSDSRELLETIRILLTVREPLARWLEEQAEFAARSGMYEVLAVDIARAVNGTREPGPGQDGHIEDRRSGRALYARLRREAGEAP